MLFPLSRRGNTWRDGAICPRPTNSQGDGFKPGSLASSPASYPLETLLSTPDIPQNPPLGSLLCPLQSRDLSNCVASNTLIPCSCTGSPAPGPSPFSNNRRMKMAGLEPFSRECRSKAPDPQSKEGEKTNNGGLEKPREGILKKSQG